MLLLALVVTDSIAEVSNGRHFERRLLHRCGHNYPPVCLFGSPHDHQQVIGAVQGSSWGGGLRESADFARSLAPEELRGVCEQQ